MRYCLEYLKDFNQTQAAIRAGFSRRSATVQAVALMNDPLVAEYLGIVTNVRVRCLDRDENSLLAELARMAHTNIKQAFRPDGSFIPLHEMPEDVVRCISAIETEEEYETRYEHNVDEQPGEDPTEVLVRTVIKKIKFWDKNKASETLAKCMKLFSNAPINVNVTLEQLVMKAVDPKDLTVIPDTPPLPPELAANLHALELEALEVESRARSRALQKQKERERLENEMVVDYPASNASAAVVLLPRAARGAASADTPADSHAEQSDAAAPADGVVSGGGLTDSSADEP